MLDESGLAKAPDLAKIFDLYNSQTSTVNTLWNIYIAIALGTLGFIYKDPEMRGNWRIKIGFTVGFLVFALSNRTAILRSQNILFAIKTFLHASAVEEGSLNRAAFVIPVGRQGTLGRNALRGFPASQLDLSLARRFQLRERMTLQFRTDFFNLFNHPSFANPAGRLSSGLFGVSGSILAGSPGSSVRWISLDSILA